MFHFRWYGGLLSPVARLSTKRNVDTLQVILFGDPRLTACLRLTGAYRSLSRPSSPAGTKAFTVRPLLIYHLSSKSVRHVLANGLLSSSLFPYAVVNEPELSLKALF